MSHKNVTKITILLLAAGRSGDKQPGTSDRKPELITLEMELSFKEYFCYFALF
jgi:hypothetical protein